MNRTLRRPHLFVALLTLALGGVPLDATTFVPMEDADLVATADLVITGRVVAKGPATSGEPATDYLVEVDRLLKGPDPGGVVMMRVLGGPGPDGLELRPFGAPRFAAGEETLLFLTAGGSDVYRPLHFMLGAFHVLDDGGERFALRNLAGTTRVESDGSLTESPRDRPRHLGRFSDWIAARSRGEDPPADYWAEKADDADPATAERFNLLEVQGTPARWFDFDSGGTVRWAAHNAGQTGVAGGGFAEFQAGLRTWTDEPRTPVSLLYVGKTTNSTAFLRPDGHNVLVFDDPRNDIGQPFNCSIGAGTLAIGGPWVDVEDTRAWKGTLFGRIAEGDIVTNKGLECFFASSRFPSEAAAEIFGHELGHTLGFHHSCGDSFSGPCDTPTKDDALMRASVHDDGRGAVLAADDLAGLRFLYEAVGSGLRAPQNLEAENLNAFTVSLTWGDASSTESGYRVYRGIGAAEKLEAVAELPPGSTSYVDEGLEADREYEYRVSAFNAGGEEKSPIVTVATSSFVTSAAVPDFRIQVTLETSNVFIPARKETSCIPDTVCFSGAVPGRSEVFVRIVGPKPNDYLWPTLVKFSTSEADIVIEQISTGLRQHYVLDGATPGSSDLPGLFDRKGFLPPDASQSPIIESSIFWASLPSAVVRADEIPPRPEGGFLSDLFPDFEFFVRITSPTGEVIETRLEDDCIEETLCVSGAVPGRSEVFLRIVGPKPNGLLWPTIVKLSTSQVEVWIEQLSTADERYYLFDAASPGSSDLTGRFDRDGFVP